MTPWQRWRWLRLKRQRAAAAESLNDCALRKVLVADLPNPGRRLDHVELLAIDLEMTGLDSHRDEIISIGWVPINAGARGLAIDLSGCGHVLVKNGIVESVGQSATIHGIRDCDREPGIELEAALEELFIAQAGRIPVFHHAPLDCAFLNRACKDLWQTDWITPTIDTLAWHRKRQLRNDDPAAANNTALDAALNGYGLPPRAHHHALDDALSCAELVLILAAEARPRLIDVCC
ncbi:MAG: 3'-5' exonuclease [Pseudomonadota bacterium]